MYNRKHSSVVAYNAINWRVVGSIWPVLLDLIVEKVPQKFHHYIEKQFKIYSNNNINLYKVHMYLPIYI